MPTVVVNDKKSKKEDVLKAATQVVEEGDSDSSDNEFVFMDEPTKVSKDRKTRYVCLSLSLAPPSFIVLSWQLISPPHAPFRGKYEYAILKKAKELHAVEERLYYVRWDKTRTPADQKLELMVRYYIILPSY